MGVSQRGSERFMTLCSGPRKRRRPPSSRGSRCSPETRMLRSTVARDYIKTHGKDLHGQSLDQYFIHGLGHYIGLNVHNPGITKFRSDLARLLRLSRESIFQKKTLA